MSGEPVAAAATTEVVLCTYNGQDYIEAQLESLLCQTRPVARISIFDDASTDGTADRIRAFIGRLAPAARAVFRLVVHPHNLGYARNFAHAVGQATEDILFLCDQDDVWESRKVERLLDEFAHHGVDMVLSDGALVDGAGRPARRRSVLQAYGLAGPRLRGFGAAAFAHLVRRNYVNGAACAVRRSAAQRALPLPADMPHDYWLALWCALHGGISIVPDALYRYRQHGGNAIGMGADCWLHAWLGIWRNPRAPRERELRIWAAVTDRIDGIARPDHLRLAREKRDWLTGMLDPRRSPAGRLVDVLRSLADGRYRRLSPGDAPLRDLVAILRRATPSEPSSVASSR